MFAAFAVALAGRPLASSDQRRRAARLRAAAAAHIASSSSFDGGVLGTGTKSEYVRRMATPGIWGGGPELAALATMYRVVVLIVDFAARTSYEAARSQTPRKTVILSYVANSHYDAVVCSLAR